MSSLNRLTPAATFRRRPVILLAVIAPAALWLAPTLPAAIVLDGSQNPYSLNPAPAFAEGLLEGTLAGAFNETGVNPGNGALGGVSIVDRPRLGECRDDGTPGPQWATDTTYIYTGQFFDADGTFTFCLLYTSPSPRDS